MLQAILVAVMFACLNNNNPKANIFSVVSVLGLIDFSSSRIRRSHLRKIIEITVLK